MIILQLKSIQTREALDTLSNIIKSIHQKFDYKIKGHEIHEIIRNMEKIPLSHRANVVSSFCARNEIEYLSYHAPRIKANIYDKKESQKIINSIRDTIIESEKVASDVHIKRTTIVFHLTNYIQNEEGYQITRETKLGPFFISDTIQFLGFERILYITCDSFSMSVFASAASSSLMCVFSMS